MKVSIVIPSFNTDFLLEKNLPVVLKASTNPGNNILEVIIVDDASKDKSASIVKEKFPTIRLFRHKINRGFSASVNTGVRSARGDLICLLNTDVLPSVDFLEKALPHFENPKVFAVSLNEIGSYSWAKGSFRNGFIEHEPGTKDDKPHFTFWVSGGSGVFRRSTWVHLGGMDEKLLSPFYWEDIDLCYRAMKRGYELLWEPEAKVEHKHESTIKQLSQSYVQRIRERNQLLFIWKNLTSPNLFRKHLVGLFRRIFTHPGYVRIVFMSLLRIGVVLKGRAKEKREAKVSDEVIFSRFSKINETFNNNGKL